MPAGCRTLKPMSPDLEDISSEESWDTSFAEERQNRCDSRTFSIRGGNRMVNWLYRPTAVIGAFVCFSSPLFFVSGAQPVKLQRFPAHQRSSERPPRLPPWYRTERTGPKTGPDLERV